LEDDNWFICHNVEDEDDCCLLDDSLGYKCNFNICDDWAEGDYDVTNIQPKPRTIDDLECGDYVVRDGCVSKCLGRCGEIVSLSYSDKGSTIGNWDKQYYLSYTMWELKNYGYTLYQPEEVKETDIDKCIKVVEEYFKKLVKPVEYSETVQDAIVQALKNLKNRYETKNN
jgi:hypothetical protein